MLRGGPRRFHRAGPIEVQGAGYPAYEERKGAKDAENAKNAKNDENASRSKDTKKNPDSELRGQESDNEKSADGMMSGVVPGAGKKDDAKKLLPPTVWGRYAKILLSSSEFLFIN